MSYANIPLRDAESIAALNELRRKIGARSRERLYVCPVCKSKGYLESFNTKVVYYHHLHDYHGMYPYLTIEEEP